MNKVLILGSGMMVEPLIDILLKKGTNQITLASNMYDTVKIILQKRNNPNLKGEEIDVKSDQLLSLIDKHDLVVSYVPPSFHSYVAKACLACKKHMITTSYVSEEMKNMHNQVKNDGLIFMNEIGLDPGIDHLITYKVINETKSRGDKILSYESWCGSLCSPDNIDNPLLYKFAWSPKGVLIAMKNDAKIYLDNKEIVVKNDKVLTQTVDRTFHSCFNFEGYYNRDSLKYKELYNFNDAETVIRGTIRFKGFSFVFQCMKNLGLFNEENIEFSIWKEYFDKLISDNSKQIDYFEEKFKNELSKESFVIDSKDTKFYSKLASLALSKFDDTFFNYKNIIDLYNKLMSCLVYLEFSNHKNVFKEKNLFDSFAILLQEKIQIRPGEKDIVFMQNEFKIRCSDGKIRKRQFNLIVSEGHNGLPYTATSLLVSLPCAVTTQLILDGKIKERGVLMPENEIIVKEVINELEKNQIFILEEKQVKAKF